jgi:hypothetical protein
MRAVLADLSVPRYLATAAAQALPGGLGRDVGCGAAGLLSLRDDLHPPALPDGPGWLLRRPELAGICGSDLAVAHAKTSIVLSGYYTARQQIPGHEIVAVVDATGDRVVLDPVLSCTARAPSACCSPRCAASTTTSTSPSSAPALSARTTRCAPAPTGACHPARRPSSNWPKPSAAR